MVELNFDISSVQTNDYEPLAPGVYDGEIVAAEQRTSGTGNDYLSLQIRLGNNRVVFDNLNLWHKTSEAAVEIAIKKLAEIAKAIGVGNISDSNIMLTKPMNFRIGLRRDDQKQNEVIAYEPPDSMPPPAGAQAAITAPLQEVATAAPTPPWQG
tara:strand:+ start:589 stop:1050 length:462 start_codon:yes stop_codon:yes gene_type:complete